MASTGLRGKVVLNKDGIPVIEISNGVSVPPTMALYAAFSSKDGVNDAKDADFRAFQSGYLRQERGFGLRAILRSLLDNNYAQRMNLYMAFYEAGLKARGDLEKKVGESVEI